MFGTPPDPGHVCDKDWGDDSDELESCSYCQDMGKLCMEVSLLLVVAIILVDLYSRSRQS